MTGLKQKLLDDHAWLECLLRQLAQAVDANDTSAELHDCWTRFEAALRAHLDTEERSLFPAVGSKHRQELEALRAEHRRIRQLLGELGVALELHTLRKPELDEFVLVLHDHAERENHSLYDWLEAETDGTALRRLLDLFGHREHAAENRAASPIHH